MKSSSKVGPIPLNVWYCIFILLQIFIIVCFIALIGGTRWVYSEVPNTLYLKSDFNSTHSGYFDGSSFKGSLHQCTEGCTKTYIEESLDWCDINIQLNKTDNPCNHVCPEIYIAKTLCKTFGTLFIGEIAVLVLGSISCLTLFVLAVSMFCACKRMRCIKCTYISVVLAASLMFCACIVWVGNVTWGSGNCQDFPGNGNLLNICGSSGPRLAIFMAVFFPLFAIFFITIMRKLENFVEEPTTLKQNPETDNNPSAPVEKTDFENTTNYPIINYPPLPNIDQRV